MSGFETILPFLKPIEHLILDDTISEVMVNGPHRVFVEKAGFVDGAGMNDLEKPTPPVPSASGYILENFKPSDRIAVLVLNRQLGETTQRITTAQKAASPEFQAWLRYKNANGADIYMGMNALQHHASTRTKDDIEKISHVYLDLDHGGTASLEALENSDLVPRPNYVLDTSPGKFQVVWKVDGMTMEEAEALN